ncbi:hypothetical protein [Streptomyces microflavus]|uniref:hypothetical protein n=1 Tax=Streptomyces microflavus TaxID=1919 RepID=UPI0036541698
MGSRTGPGSRRDQVTRTPGRLHHRQTLAAAIEICDQNATAPDERAAVFGQGPGLLLEPVPAFPARGACAGACACAGTLRPANLLLEVQTEPVLPSADLRKLRSEPVQGFLTIQKAQQEGVLVAASGGGAGVDEDAAVGGEEFRAALRGGGIVGAAGDLGQQIVQEVPRRQVRAQGVLADRGVLVSGETGGELT